MSEYRYFLGYYLKYRKEHIINLILVFSNSFIAIGSPYIIQKVFDIAIVDKDIDLLIQYLVFFFILNFIQGAINFYVNFSYARIGQKILLKIRFDLLNKLELANGKFLNSLQAGDFTTVIDSDVMQVEEFFTDIFVKIIIDVIYAVGMIIFLGRISIRLVIIYLIMQIPIFILQKIVSRHVSENTYSIRTERGVTNNYLNEYTSNIITIKLVNLSNYLEAKIKKRFMNLSTLLGKFYYLNYGNTFASRVIGCLSTAGVIYFGGKQVINGELSIGQFMIFNTYASAMLAPIFRIAQFKLNLQKTIVSLRRINVYLANDEYFEDGGITLENTIEKIEFRNVYFGYFETKSTVLENISISFLNNKIISIVGSSGCGKSTIIKLIMRLWDVREGEILLNNENIKKYTIFSLRNKISIVSQDVFLFNGTILENIICSNDKITFEEVVELAKHFGIHEFISNQKDGYYTNVSSGGVSLSGGESQKISILRAIISDNNIIVFDEATSAMDSIFEQKLMSNLNRYLENKLIIMIAHKIKNVINSDLIYVLNSGEIISSGTHNELIDNCEFYNKLYNSSTSKGGETNDKSK